MKILIRLVIFHVMLMLLITPHTILGQQNDSLNTKIEIKEKLPKPFGTIVILEAEIIDGDEFHEKGTQAQFFLKIIKVDSIFLNEPIIIGFKDESQYIPNNYFDLYKLLYNKETGQIDSKTAQEMNKRFIGKKYKIAAYESGRFEGIPNKYNEYVALIPQAKSFHFSNYIVIIADLTDGK